MKLLSVAKRGVDRSAFVDFRQFCIAWSVGLSTLQLRDIHECTLIEVVGCTLLCHSIDNERHEACQVAIGQCLIPSSASPNVVV